MKEININEIKERLEGESLMVSVKLLTRDGEVYVRVEDEKLTENGLDEDMYVKKGLI